MNKGSLPYREIVARVYVRIIHAPKIPLGPALEPGADGVIGGSNKHYRLWGRESLKKCIYRYDIGR